MNEMNNNKTNSSQENSKLIAIAIIAAVVFIAIICGALGGSSKSKSKWDSLSKDEKAWYERNYGNGKAEKINKAIKDYKKTHK